MNDKIKVIWIDDQIEEFDALIEKALKYDINIKECTCWVKAEAELKSNWESYDAIILDANCKFDDVSTPDIDDFLGNVLEEIPPQLPYFIYSAAGESNFLRKRRPKSTDPDYEWKVKNNRSFYSKNRDEDEDALFRNIRSYAMSTPRYKLKNIIYKNVFEAIESLGLDSEVKDNLTDLLLPIHFGETTVKEYNEKASYFRKSLEHVFRSMYGHGMLPKGYVNSNTGGRVNISGSFDFIKEYFAPELISNLMDGAKSLASMMLHTSESKEDSFDSYTRQIKSPYLLQSMSIWLCDFILWYDNHVRAHNKQENEDKWRGKVDKNLEGLEGELKWNDYHRIWTIGHKFRLDKKEKGCQDRNAYKEGQKCIYIPKQINNSEKGETRIFATAIDLI